MTVAISAKVSESLRDRIDAAREQSEDGEYEESRSQAIKRLIRAGLDAEEQDRGRDTITITFPTFAAYAAWLIVAGAFMDASTDIGYLALGVVAVTSLYEIAVRKELL